MAGSTSVNATSQKPKVAGDESSKAKSKKGDKKGSSGGSSMGGFLGFIETSLSLPYSMAMIIGWFLFFLLWYFAGIPLGPGTAMTYGG